MKQMLEALWNGQIAPAQSNGVYDPEMEHLAVLMDRNREALDGKLTQEQKDIFQKYIACSDEFTYLSAAQAFSTDSALRANS